MVHAFPDLPPSWDEVVLPVDKPYGMTSFDVIRVLRRLTGVRRRSGLPRATAHWPGSA